MRPTPIPDEEVWPGTTRLTIAPPGGNFLDPEVSAVEALFETSSTRVNRYSVRLALEGDDLARFERGDPLWLSINCPQMPVFSVGFAVFSVATGRCRNCRKVVVAEAPVEEWTPETAVFHQFPGDTPGCGLPEIEWVEANPPNMTRKDDLPDLQTLVGEHAEKVYGDLVQAWEKTHARADLTRDPKDRLGRLALSLLVSAHAAGIDLLDALEGAIEEFLALEAP